MQTTSGNAARDGAPFDFWFVGDLQKWTQARTHADVPKPNGLRQSQVLEMKWGAHEAGAQRRDWAPCASTMTMSLLVRGKFLLRFRSAPAREEIVECRLEREGDYVIWGTDVEHTWIVEEDSVILTVRWREPGV
jgi:hypothetical protein